jgi:uncharacterized protein
MAVSIKIFQKRVHRILTVALALFLWSLYSPANAQADTPATQEVACNGGNSAACTALGIRLLDGVGIAKDEKRGADLFLKACQGQARDAQGCMLWGYAMETGRGAYVNLAQSAAFYDIACELGNAIGCNNYGLMRQNGRGVVKNELYAAGAFAKSCRLGAAIGCVNEGRLHADAMTLTQDRALAVQAFDRGCTLGSMDGCNVLAWHLERGLGTSRDTPRAALLYTRACQGGFQLACANGQLLAGVSANAASQPQPANAAVGHVVCSVINTQEKKMWVTWGFTAPESRHQELANAYLQKLLSDGAIPRTGNFSNLALDCRGHRSLADAVRFKNDLMRGAARGRYVFTATIFNPI